ncbi:MAG: ABC transporter permease [Dehalococcoidia bacterium]|nr:ABC transporter permease [Dehalococcoidia bacterium]
MQRFIARRLVFALLSFLAATFIVFGMSRLAGDPLLIFAQPGGYGMTEERRAELTKYLNLDKPFVIQYFLWAGNAFHGDLGRSLVLQYPVTKMIKQRIGATAQLALAAWLFAALTGVTLGVYSAVNRGGFWDYVGRAIALFGQALPQFWVGIMGIVIFAVTLDWLPAQGRGYPDASLWTQLKHFVLPTVTVGWAGSATYLRLTRSAMLEVLDSEYIKLARIKGVAEWKVVWKHAFRNAFIAPITYSTLFLASFITGATVVELVFSWPGIGRLALAAVFDNDYAILTGIVLVFAIAYIVLSFLADILYAALDPRIRYT